MCEQELLDLASKPSIAYIRKLRFRQAVKVFSTLSILLRTNVMWAMLCISVGISGASVPKKIKYIYLLLKPLTGLVSSFSVSLYLGSKLPRRIAL